MKEEGFSTFFKASIPKSTIRLFGFAFVDVLTSFKQVKMDQNQGSTF
jgi:hypothetical protein